MSEANIAPAVTEAEVHAAQQIAISIFEAASGIREYASYKAHLWRQDPTFKLDNLILCKFNGEEPCGMVRIVPRTICRADQEFSVAGISSVCVTPERRGRGLSVLLMEKALAICRDRQFDFAFLFARRAADNYYTRFSFWGIASYSQVSVRTVGLADNRSFSFGDADIKLVELYEAAYNHCYDRTFGRTVRSTAYWHFLLSRLQYLTSLRFSTLLLSGIPVGYVIWSKRAIHELSFVDSVEIEPLVAFLSNIIPGAKDVGNLTFELSLQHRIIQAAYGLELTVSVRECAYGGHMACILNPEALLHQISKRAPASGARLAHLVSAKRLSHRDTCRLLGVWSPTDPVSEDALPYDMSVADHF